MAKYAVIDIGTNSIKFHIAEQDAAGHWSVVADENNICRLGEGLQTTGTIGPAAMERNVAVVAEMAQRAQAHRVNAIAAVGTMGLRAARNAREFVERVRDACGVTVEIISGEEEARLAYVAVQSGMGIHDGNIGIFDTGGGSTEFIFGSGKRINTRFSVNVGAVRYTEQLLVSDPVTDGEFRQAAAAIEQDFADNLQFDDSIDVLVGIGGTMNNLCAVEHQLTHYDADVIQGSALTLEEVERQIALYQSKTIAERKTIVGLQPQRADVILAGAIIVSVIMKKAGVTRLTVSARGLRHALLIDRFA